MEKIIIVGCPGAGKPTFGRELGAKLHIPVHHLDAHFWKEGWSQMGEDDFRALQTQLTSEPRWIIDGHFRKSIHVRTPQADTVILFDFNKFVIFWRVLKRFLRYRGEVRPDMGGGNKEVIQWQLIKYILRYDRKKIEAYVRPLAEGKNFVILRNSTQVADFLTHAS